MNIWYVPISISFSSNLDFKKNIILLSAFEFIPFFIFFLDIFFNSNTAFFSKGIVIYEKEEILKNYIQNEFLLDFITLFPFYFTSILNKAKLLDLLYFFRIIKLSKLLFRMEEYLQVSDKFQYIFRLIKLFFYILYIAHVCGCIWHFTAFLQIQNGSNQTWLNVSGLADSLWYSKYINSLYFAVLTMITVGHISTQSDLEKTISIFIVLILSLVFAYSINTIGMILQELNNNENDLKFINIFFLL